jgi:hypothetical protein
VTPTVTDEELARFKIETAIIRDEAPDPRDPHKIKWKIVSAVAQFCDCKAWRMREGGFQFCGMTNDVDWAVWLFDRLTDFVAVALVKHLMTSLAPTSERSKIVKGFVIGATERISERLIELCKPPADQSDNSKALVIIKSKAIDDKMSELGIKLGLSRSRSISFNGGAYESGRQSGDKASFGRPVSGAVGGLRLGKA